MRIHVWGLAAAAVVWLGAAAGPCRAGFILSLGAPTFTGPSGQFADFNVNLNYAADEANDSPLVGLTHEQPYVITFVRIDVRQSSAALAPGGDFSAFSFLPSGLLTSWDDSSDPSGGIFRFDTLTDATGIALGTNTSLGTIRYDLSAFGLTPSTALSISIVGDPSQINGPTLFGTEDPRGLSNPFDMIPDDPVNFPGNSAVLQAFLAQTGFDATWADTFGFVDPSFTQFNPGSQPLALPSTAVPEPASLSLAASAGLCLGFYARRRRKPA
jgi:hypothetical protein